MAKRARKLGPVNFHRKQAPKRRKFNGKTFKYVFSVSDVAHGGPGRTSIDQFAALMSIDNTTVRTNRISVGWDVYTRKPFFSL